AGQAIRALLDVDVTLVVNGAIRIGVEHRIGSSKDGHHGEIVLDATPGVVDCGLHVTGRFHPFVVDVNHELVAAYEVVVLPRARVARVNSLPALVMKLRAIAGDVNGTPGFGEGRRTVGLFLAVIGTRRAAAGIRDVVSEIGIEFGRFRAAARVPDGRLAAP